MVRQGFTISITTLVTGINLRNAHGNKRQAVKGTAKKVRLTGFVKTNAPLYSVWYFAGG